MSATTEKSPVKKATVTMPSDRTVHIERVFDATRERVWEALTKPELLAQWWGRGNKLDVETYELRRGGHWRFVEHAHGQTHGFEGRFREITPPSKLVYSFEWDGMPTHVAIETITLDDLGDGRTRMVTDALFLTVEDRDGMMSSGAEGGMNESYAALDRLLAAAW
jgi:uncharacterized protein YndB with AHSA1/START domain